MMDVEEEWSLIRSGYVRDRIRGIERFTLKYDSLPADKKDVIIPTDVYCEMMKYWIAVNVMVTNIGIIKPPLTFESTTIQLILIASTTFNILANWKCPFDVLAYTFQYATSVSNDVLEVLLATEHNTHLPSNSKSKPPNVYFLGCVGHISNEDECDIDRCILMLLAYGMSKVLIMRSLSSKILGKVSDYIKDPFFGKSSLSLARYAYFMHRRILINESLNSVKNDISAYKAQLKLK